MPLEDLLKNIQKDYVKKYKKDAPTIQLASQLPPVTGLVVDNPMFEKALDRRFLAYGRCYLIYGKKGNSKTSLFFYLAKLFQQQGGDVVWVETEQAADLDYAKKQGVNLDKLAIPRVNSLQEALTTVEFTIKNLPKSYPDGNTPVLICLDSIAGGIPEYEQDESVQVGETKVGEHARLMSSFYRRIVTPLSNEKAIFVALNQLKEKIGGTGGFGGEAPEALIGGEAQRFHSTCQWKVVRTKDIVVPDSSGAPRKVGSKHEMTVKRNKLGREGNSEKAEYDLYINGGLDWYGPLVRELSDAYAGSGLISKSGGWYTWNIPNIEYLKTNDDGVPEKTVIDTNQKFREWQLGNILMNSPAAKELVREKFGIPPMPSQKEIEAVEAEMKKRRKKTVSDDDDEEKSPREML